MIFCFKTKNSLRNTCSGQKELSNLTPIVWSSLLTNPKLPNSLNNLKRKVKDYFFKKLRNMEQDVSLLDATLGTSTVIFFAFLV